MMHLTSVDFPAPFSPSRAWKDPAGTSIDTSCSAFKAPKDLLMPMVSSDGAREGRCGFGHGNASRKDFDGATAPNTPPCIFTILSAA